VIGSEMDSLVLNGKDGKNIISNFVQVKKANRQRHNNRTKTKTKLDSMAFEANYLIW
jgi:hypothetical protein